MHARETSALPPATEEALRAVFEFPHLPEDAVRAYQAAEVAKVPYSAVGHFLNQHRTTIEPLNALFIAIFGVLGGFGTWIGRSSGNEQFALGGLAILLPTILIGGTFYYLYWHKKWLLPARWETRTLEDYLKSDDALTMLPSVRAFADAAARIDPRGVAVFVLVLIQDDRILDPIIKINDYRHDSLGKSSYGPVWKDGKIVSAA